MTDPATEILLQILKGNIYAQGNHVFAKNEGIEAIKQGDIEMAPCGRCCMISVADMKHKCGTGLYNTYIKSMEWVASEMAGSTRNRPRSRSAGKR